jgi:hypothetical protein
MPASAVATGLFDYVLTPEKMAEQWNIHSSRSRIDPRISGEVFSMTQIN